jgi:hypothetical protein
MRHKPMIFGVVAQATVRGLLNKLSDLWAPAGRVGAVGYVHVVVVVEDRGLSSWVCALACRNRGSCICGVPFRDRVLRISQCAALRW